MSTLKADAVTAQSTNQDLDLSGNGTGVPDLAAGFKVGSVAGVPTASIRDDAVTLAKLAAGTDGELITWDASGDPAVVAVGTATHILTSNGAGAAPTFQAAGGGGAWSVLTSGTFSSATTVEITGITKTTKLFFNTTWSDAGAVYKMRTSSDGGSSYDSGASDYEYYLLGGTSGAASLTQQASAGANGISGMGAFGYSTTAGASATLEFTLYDPSNTSNFTLVHYTIIGVRPTGDDNIYCNGSAMRKSAADVDAFQLLFSGAAGTFSGNYVVTELN